jgi:hypothetical protein
MIGKLIEYLGFTGLLSLLLIVVAVGLAVYGFVKKARLRWSAMALLCGVLAWFFAWLVSDQISRVPLGQSAEIAAQQERQEQVRLREEERLRQQAGGLSFAEDAPGDELDPAGLSSPAELEALERRRASTYAYRDRGPQQRIGADGEPVISESGADVEEESVPSRAFTAEESAEAGSWGENTLLLAQTCAFLLALFFVWDYARRLNRFRHEVFPLPLPGRWVNPLEKKEYQLHLDMPPGEEGMAALSEWVSDCLKKGEQVLLLGLPDPFPKDDELFRLSGPMPLMGVPKWVIGKESLVDHPSLWLEAAWYGRAWVVVKDEGAIRALLSRLPVWISWHEKTGAHAHDTVNLFLDADLLKGKESEADSADRAAAMDFRVLNVSTRQSAPPVRG